jgi:hypothetical protein
MLTVKHSKKQLLIQRLNFKLRHYLNLTREYLEGDFKADKPTAAIRGFQKFLEQYQLARH